MSRYQLIGGLGNTELVGGVDEVDDEDQDAMVAELVGEIGAMNKPRSRKTRLAVDAQKLRLARRMAIGFGPTLVESNDEALVTSQPQVVFRPERLFIPSDIAFDLLVIDVKIGQRSQLVAAGALPGAMFSEVSVDVFTHWDTAEVGNVIALTISNINADEDISVRAAMVGAAAIR